MLTNEIIRLAEIRETEYVLSDEDGLYVRVMKSGRKTFGMQYTFAGKRKTLLLGVFPDLLIEQARQKRDEYKAAAKAGTDPAEARGIIYKLTEEMIRDARPRGKVYYLTDQNNLSVAIEPTGGKYFSFIFRFKGKRHGITLGHYPEISLEEARRRQKESRDKLSLGQRPVSYPREVQYKLTEEIVRNARPSEEDYRLTDQRGLFLQVRKITGSKTWGMQYDSPADGRDRTLKLGDYPDLSLADARKKHEKALALIAKGRDPADIMRIIEYKLTEEVVQAAEPREKTYYLTDQRSLALEIRPAGSKAWKLQYKFNGKWRGVVLGHYPETSLNQARQIQELILELARKNVDPATQAPLPVMLTEGMVRNAPVKDVDYRLYDTDGLYLDVLSNGKKKWGVSVGEGTARHDVALGEYPASDLFRARFKRDAVLRGGGVQDKAEDHSSWRTDVQRDAPPKLYFSEIGETRKSTPQMIAYQRNRLRYLVYLDDRRDVFEIVDGAKDEHRTMTEEEAKSSLELIRRELSPKDLAKVEEALAICDLRAAGGRSRVLFGVAAEKLKPVKKDMRRKEWRTLENLHADRKVDPGKKEVYLVYSDQARIERAAKNKDAEVFLLEGEERPVMAMMVDQDGVNPFLRQRVRYEDELPIYRGLRKNIKYLVTAFNRVTDEGRAWCQEKGVVPDPAVIRAMAEKPASPRPGVAPLLKEVSDAFFRIMEVQGVSPTVQGEGCVRGSVIRGSAARKRLKESALVLVTAQDKTGGPRSILIGRVREGVVQEFRYPSGRVGNLYNIQLFYVCADWKEAAARLQGMGAPVVSALPYPEDEEKKRSLVAVSGGRKLFMLGRK